MKIFKGIVLMLVGIALIGWLSIVCLGIGGDIYYFIPLWLTKLTLGFIGAGIIIILGLVFAAGIFTIVKFIKGDWHD